MLAQESWYLSTAERGRRRLFPRGIMAVFTATMILVGLLTLPSKSLHERLANAHESNLLTVAYLHAWLNAVPDDWQLKMTLARHQALLGQHNDALRSLTHLRERGPEHLQRSVTRVLINVLERMAFESGPGTALREQLLARVRGEMEGIALASNDPIEIEAFYHRALAVGHSSLAATLLGRMAKLTPGSRHGDILARSGRSVEDFAREAIALGDFRLAAEFYWRAFDEAHDNDSRLHILTLVARAEQAGSRLPEFFVALEDRLTMVQLDVARYKQLVKLAMANNRLDLAERFVKDMLKYSGGWAPARLAQANMLLQSTWQWLGQVVAVLNPVTHAAAATRDPARPDLPAGLPGPMFEFTLLNLPVVPDLAPLLPLDEQATQTAPSDDPLAPLIATLLARENAMPATPIVAGRIETEESDQINTDDPVDPLASLLISLGEASPPVTNPLVTLPTTPPPIDHVLARASLSSYQRVPGETAGAANPQVSNVPAPDVRIRPLADEEALNPAASGYQPLDRALATFDATARFGPPAENLDNARRNFDRLIDTLHADALVQHVWETGQSASHRPTGPRPHLAFDHELYDLAFQVFLAKSNLDDAYLIALSATEKAPKRLDWAVRLAQVAEWSQRPIPALETWFGLATQTGRKEYWSQVERLSIGLRDENRYASYLLWSLRQHPGDIATLVKLSETYERQGDPAQSIQMLQQVIPTLPDTDRRKLLVYLSHLADRSGDARLLIDTLAQAEREFGPDPEWAVRVAASEHSRGRTLLALDALRRATDVARNPIRHDALREKEIGFWSIYASVANELQQRGEAIDAYAQMLRLGTYDREDISNLAQALAPRSPEGAADALAHGYFRFEDEAMARHALTLWLQAGQIENTEAFLARLPGATRKAIESGSEFLRERSAYFQSVDRFEDALADLVKIHRNDPADMDNRAAMLWLTLARRDGPRLRAMLYRWRDVSLTEPRLWGAYGAGLLALDEPEQALPYFVRQARKGNDYLWWLAYADALDVVGHVDAAWQLRRRAWTELRNTRHPDKPDRSGERERVVALALQFSPADEADELLRSLIRERMRLVAPVKLPAQAGSQLPLPDDEAAGEPGAQALGGVLAHLLAQIAIDPRDPDPLVKGRSVSEVTNMRVSASELAVSYLLSQEASDVARGWLMSRYAQDLVKPAWAELSMALASNDGEQLDHLLATVSDWLPKLDQVQAMARNGRFAEAQTLAFDTAAARPNNDSAHQMLVDQMLTGGPSAGITSSRSSEDAYTRETTRLDAAMRLGQHSRAYGFVEHDEVISRNASLLQNPGKPAETIGLGLAWLRHEGRWSGEIAQRNAQADGTPIRLRWERPDDPLLSLSATVGLAQPSNDSAAMVAGGQKDLIEISGRYNLTGREYLAGQIEVARLETQQGTGIGRANRLSLELGHRLRLEYPDLTLRAVLGYVDYTRNNTSDPVIARLAPSGATDPVSLFVPSSSTQMDLFLTAGSSIRDNYTRALRPFGEVGAHYNTDAGASMSLRAGVSTSVLGTDRLTLFGAWRSKSTSSPGGNTEFGLAYRLHY